MQNQLAKKSTHPRVEPKYVDPKQAAQILSCSPQTITKLIRERRLPAVYLSRSAVRIAVADLQYALEPYNPDMPRGNRRKKAGAR